MRAYRHARILECKHKNKLNTLSYYLSVFSFIFSFSEAAFETNETRLYRELFEKYNKQSRPVLNQSEAVTVVFDFQLIRIVDVVSGLFSSDPVKAKDLKID